MNSFIILFSILSIIFGIVSFVATDNIISTLIVVTLSLLYFFLFALPKIKKVMKENTRFHSCYTFINSFIISLSVKPSLLTAFSNVTHLVDKESRETLEGIVNLKEEERLDYLKKIFNFDIYYLFLSVIKIWIEEGGDILRISHYLSEESRRKEEYLIHAERIMKRRSVDFAILWLFTLLIVVMLRFTLTSFYSYITNQVLFQVCIVSLFILILFSVHLLLMGFTNVHIGGNKNE